MQRGIDRHAIGGGIAAERIECPAERTLLVTREISKRGVIARQREVGRR